MLEIGANCTREWRRRNPNRRGVNLVTGDQTDVTLLARLAHEEAPWDVVIDDGSHINKLTLPTFYTTFPCALGLGLGLRLGLRLGLDLELRLALGLGLASSCLARRVTSV